MPINAYRVTLYRIKPLALISALVLPIHTIRAGFTGQTMEAILMGKMALRQMVTPRGWSQSIRNGTRCSGDMCVACVARFLVNAQGQWFDIESAQGTRMRKHWP